MAQQEPMMYSQARMISEAAEDLEEASAGEQPHRRAMPPLRRALVAAMGLIAGLALAGLAMRSYSSAGLSSNHLADATELEESDKPLTEKEREAEILLKHPCRGYPNLFLVGIEHNNLGKKGPSKGKEGMVFHAKDKTDPENIKDVDLEINALSDYTPNEASQNGMNGKYGTINVKAGSSVHVKFTIRDHDGETLKLPKSAITWFDLDEGKNHSSSERVCSKGHDEVHVTKKTETKTAAGDDGATCYHATKYGTGSDNPTDPLKLDELQINRAVSFVYHEKSHMDFTIGASKGNAPRYFTFAGRPSVLCANIWKDGKLISHGGCMGQGPSMLLTACLLGLMRLLW